MIRMGHRSLQGWQMTATVGARCTEPTMGTTAPQRRLSAVAAHVHPPLPLPPPPPPLPHASAAAAAAGGARGIVDLEFFREHGYVIVPQVVPPEQVAAAVDEIGALLGMDMANPADWYEAGGEYGKAPVEVGPGMVELYQSQGLWDNRCASLVHRAFAEVLGSEELLVTMDRCNFKPPARGPDDGWSRGLPLHWDSSAEPIEVTGKAGDLLIWNRLLPHGNQANLSATPRIAQFISMHRKDAAPRSRRRDGVSPADELDNCAALAEEETRQLLEVGGC